MEEYLFKVKTLVDNLKGKEIHLPKQVVISWVLNSLSTEYEGFTTNIVQALRNSPDAYTVESLFSSLIDEARGKESNNSQNKLLYINNNKNNYKKLSGGLYCQHCKLASHNTKNCFFLFPEQAPKSWKVNKTNVKGQNKGKQSNNNKDKQRQALITALAKLDTSAVLDQTASSNSENANSNNNGVEELNMVHEQLANTSAPDDIMDQEVCNSSYNLSYDQDNNPYTLSDTRPRGYHNLVKGGSWTLW